MTNVPNYIREGLKKQNPSTLRRIAEMAENLAEQKERELEKELQERTVEDDELPDDVREYPDDVPGKACVTTKTIDGNDYYYYQWREGDKIKSEYIRPVNPKQ